MDSWLFALLVLAASINCAAQSTTLNENFMVASSFGVVGDDSTDNTAAFTAIHNYLLAHDGTVLAFGPGTYRYRNNNWLQGVKNVHVLGNGASFRNVITTNVDVASAPLVVNQDYFANPDNLGVTVALTPIQAAVSHNTSVTTVRAPHAGNFKAGDPVLIAGYNQQDGGFPPNLRYFEVHKVVSTNSIAGTIMLDQPLIYSYDTRWYSQTETGLTVGPPIALDLNRTGTAAFTLAQSVLIEDAAFLANPNHAVGNVAGYGALQVQGFVHFECNHCTVGSLSIGDGQTALIRNSVIYTAEPDKLLDTLVFDSDLIYGMGQATGVNNLTIQDSTDFGGMSVSPRQLTLRNNQIYPGSNTQKDGALMSIGSGPVLANPVYTATIVDNTFHQPIGYSVAAMYAGIHGQTLTALTAPTGSSITTSLLWQVMMTIGPGSLLTTSGGKTCEVTAIYFNGRNLTIEGVFSSPPVDGDVYGFTSLHDLVAYGNGWGTQTPGTLVRGGDFDRILVSP